jgi:hypothetical protein
LHGVVRRVAAWRRTQRESDRLAHSALPARASGKGWPPARAHARSGDGIQIAAYLGSGPRFDQAIADFAESYAEQNERDVAAFAAAVRSGRITAAAAT